MRETNQPRKMLRIKGARHAHRTILAQGRKLCAEATAQRILNRAREKQQASEQAKMEQATGSKWRVTNTLTD